MTESTPTETTPPVAFSRPLSDEDLRAARRGLSVREQASATERARIAELHGLLDLEALSYEARLEPLGRSGWRLSGRVRARLTQECVVTLEPVPAVLDEPFERLWSPDAPEPGDDADARAGRFDLMAQHLVTLDPEFAEQTGLSDGSPPGAPSEEPPELERTPDLIDPATAALETFTLALDPYPRAKDVSFSGVVHGPPGEAPLTDEATRPFASLDQLRKDLAAQSADAGAEEGPDAPKEKSSEPKIVDKNGETPPDAEKA